MISKEERLLRLLDYLQRYTDDRNPTSFTLMDYYFTQKGLPDFFGPKSSRRKTKRTMIREMVRVLNSDVYGNPLPKEQWRVMYDGCDNPDDRNQGFIHNLYYIQPFSQAEVNALTDSVRHNTTLSTEERTALLSKIQQHLANENYKSTDPRIRRGMNPVDKKQYLEKKRAFQRHLSATLRRKMNDD